MPVRFTRNRNKFINQIRAPGLRRAYTINKYDWYTTIHQTKYSRWSINNCGTGTLGQEKRYMHINVHTHTQRALYKIQDTLFSKSGPLECMMMKGEQKNKRKNLAGGWEKSYINRISSQGIVVSITEQQLTNYMCILHTWLVTNVYLVILSLSLIIEGE